MNLGSTWNPWVPIACVLLVASAPAATTLPVPDVPPAGAVAQPDRAEERLARIGAIEKEYLDASLANSREVRAALKDVADPTPAQRQEASANAKAKAPDPAEYAARARAIVEEDAKDSAALRAYVFLYSVTAELPARAALRDAIVEHHLARAELGDLARKLATIDRALAEKIAEDSPLADVRGKYWHAIAEAIRSDISFAKTLRTRPQGHLDAMRAEPGGERIDALLALEPDAANARIVAICERLVKDYPTVVIDAGSPRERALGDWAAAQIRRIVDLAIGKVAPEIEGVDIDGVAFKLSDYRGKVVMIDFWGFW